jgi:hypothetical protein
MFSSPRTRPLAALVSAAALATFILPASAHATSETTMRLKMKKRDGQTFYCSDRWLATGTLIPQRTCLTRDDWEKQGVKFPGAAEASAAKSKKADQTES